MREKHSLLREKHSLKHEEVVVLGANGTMGAGAAEVFAAAGYHVTMLAREVEKAREGLEEVQQAARAEAIGERIQVGSYARNLSESVARAAIVFESLAEDLPLKQQFFEKVDQFRKPDSIVATVSSGLSIAQMAEGRSDSFRRHFLGIHLFNPPNVIVGTEVIPHTETDPAVVTKVVDLLQSRLGRRVIVAKDRPAFVGNRVGFKVLNEVAHLASEHGVAFMDYLIGPQTGRAMAPLATIDLVGWDVHKAIVDNVYENTEDEAHRCFELPAYMREGLSQGRLGDKTPVEGGFYRRQNKRVEVLNPQTNSYQELKAPQSLKILAEAKGDEAELARRVVLGYVSYALNRVGEVAETNNDVDIIMSYGFNWAPPSIFVDLWGPRETLEMMSRYRLKAPRVVEGAASKKKSLYVGNILNFGRTFYA